MPNANLHPNLSPHLSPDCFVTPTPTLTLTLCLEKVRDQLDAYVVIALGSCAHVVMLCAAEDGVAYNGDHAAGAVGGRFEGCSVLHATETAAA